MGLWTGHAAPVALSKMEMSLIEFERTWWAEDDSKETIIRERFDLSTTRYYDLLSDLVDSDEAYRFDPLVIHRLRRRRANRRRARFESRYQTPPAR